AIANLKTWHTPKTGYRRPINTLPDTITAILGIIFTYTL
ncbi:transposase, partial [Propionibacterium australiense]